MKRRMLLAFALVLLASAGLSQSAFATVSISRAELKGSDLRIEGEAAPNRQITVDGVVMGTSDGRGEFRIERSSYTPPADCTVAVNDGSATATTVQLSGCTVSSTPPPAQVTLSSLTVNPSSVVGGTTSGPTGTVTLSASAPAGGITVDVVSSDPAVAAVPTQVTVEEGFTSWAFTVQTQPVEASVSVTITATDGIETRTASLTVNPDTSTPPPSDPPPGGTLLSVAVEPSDGIIGGEQHPQGTVFLTESVDSDTVVALSSSNTSAATVPASATVPAGSTSATFTVTTHAVDSTQSAIIIGEAGGVERGKTIHVYPTAPDSAPTIASITFIPSRVGGGGGITGTVTLSAATTDGAVLELTSSHPDIVQVPSEVVIVRDSASQVFPVATTAVSSNTDVTITATARCCGARGTQTGTVTVTTDPPPPPDTVTIKSVKWEACIFSIRATGSNPNAILTVVLTSSGSEVLRLTNLGDGKYEGERTWRPPGTNVPVDITLKSNFGGSVSTTVSDPQGSECKADL